MQVLQRSQVQGESERQLGEQLAASMRQIQEALAPSESQLKTDMITKLDEMLATVNQKTAEQPADLEQQHVRDAEAGDSNPLTPTSAGIPSFCASCLSNRPVSVPFIYFPCGNQIPFITIADDMGEPAAVIFTTVIYHIRNRNFLYS